MCYSVFFLGPNVELSRDDRNYIWGVVINRQLGKCNSKECGIYISQAKASVLRLREGRGRPAYSNNLDIDGSRAGHLEFLRLNSDVVDKYEILCSKCHENIKPHRVNFKVHPDIYADWLSWKNNHRPDATLTSVLLEAMDRLVNRDQWTNKETWDYHVMEVKAAQYDKIAQITQQNIDNIAHDELNSNVGMGVDADLE